MKTLTHNDNNLSTATSILAWLRDDRGNTDYPNHHDPIVTVDEDNDIRIQSGLCPLDDNERVLTKLDDPSSWGDGWDSGTTKAADVLDWMSSCIDVIY